jgi:hypothetical protein
MAKLAQASPPADPQPRKPAPVKNLAVPTSPVFAPVGTADARKAATAEATIAELRAEKRELERRLWRAEEELVELRSQGQRPAEASGVALRNPAVLVNVPSNAVRVPSIPLRFSSIPAALRTGRRKKVVVAAVMLLMLLVVGAFVAGSFISRMH